MAQKTLKQWLAHSQAVHSKGVELGLERVKSVASRLALLKPNCAIIIVGGTNGKGSTVAGLEAVYMAQGYKVGAFTTPYLYAHNEQVRIQGKDCSDQTYCNAFVQIEAARGEITLTQFEFNTLVALILFKQAELDIGILEVGLGGRLDAVNIIDADVAIVTSIDIDHTDWLGDTRELIAVEKAGILRTHKPAVCGDKNPPHTLLAYAHQHHVPLLLAGKDFYYQEAGDQWQWQAGSTCYSHLPLPRLAIQNMASALMAINLLQDRLPVQLASIKQGLQQVNLPGRRQVILGMVTQIWDVAHNPAAARLLGQELQKRAKTGKVRAVFSMLGDKDILGTIKAIAHCIDEWYVAPLACERAAPLTLLQSAFEQAKIQTVNFLPTIQAAYQAAMHCSNEGDSLVVFGSFYTVGSIKV